MTLFYFQDILNTYSIVAYDAETGQMGGAVQTHQMSVGRIIPFAQPGVGVIASQSMVNMSYGPLGIDLLKAGIPPARIIDALTASDPGSARRQLAVLDARGEAAAFTGEKCIREASHFVGKGYSVQANMMMRTTVIDAMRKAYEGTRGDLAERMMATLRAAQAEDGDMRGMQSAALRIVPSAVGSKPWEIVYDLRVDEAENPIVELDRLVRLRRAQLIDNQGHELLSKGDVTGALSKWKMARDMAPSLEELPFWQAVSLAEQRPDDQAISLAARILALMTADNDRRDAWIELVVRLGECGLISRPGAVEELLEALQHYS